MAQFPILPPGGRIEPRAFDIAPQRIATSADTFGAQEARALGQLGQGLQNVGNDMSRIYEREARRQSDIEVLRAKQTLNDYELSVQRGALSTRGERATGATEQTEADLERVEQEVLATTSEGARFAVQEMFANRRRSILGNVSRHEQSEREGVELTLHESGLAGERDVFASAPVDPDGVVMPESLNRMEQNIRSHWKSIQELRGLPQEVVERSIELDVSSAHRGRVERLLANGEGMKAREYLKTNGDSMTEEDEAAVEKHVQDAALGQEAQDIADSVDALPFEEQVNHAKSIGDEQLREEVLSKLTRMKAIEDEIRSDSERQALESAWKKQGSEGAALSAFERSVMSAQAIRQWENGHARLLAGLPLVTDSAKRTEFSFLTPEERKNMTEAEYLNEWAPHFDQSDRDWAEGLLRATREGRTRAPRAVTGAMSRDETIDSAIRRALGLKPQEKLSDFNTDEAQAYQEELLDIDERVVRWEEVNKREADAVAMREIIASYERDRVFLDDWVPGAPDPIAASKVEGESLDEVMVPMTSMSLGEAAAVQQRAQANGITLPEGEVEHAVGLNRLMNNTAVSVDIRRQARDLLMRILGDLRARR